MSFGNGNGHESNTGVINKTQLVKHPYNPNQESEHDKHVLQKAMLPEWFYLGRHQYTDHLGETIGEATYSAYSKTYNDGRPIHYPEFHMLVAAIVRIVDTGNPEGKRTKSKK